MEREFSNNMRGLVATALLWTLGMAPVMADEVSDWPLHMPEGSGRVLAIPIVLPSSGPPRLPYRVVNAGTAHSMNIVSIATGHSSAPPQPENMTTVMLQISGYARIHPEHPELFVKPTQTAAGLTERLRVLLEAGANPDEPPFSSQHLSPLAMLATLPSFDGDVGMAQLLLDHHATLNATASSDSPVATAVKYKRDDLLTPMLATGRASHETLASALQQAITGENYPIAARLVGAGADPNQPQEDGGTILANPKTSDTEFIDALVTHGAQVRFPTEEADRYRQHQVRLDPVVWSILNHQDYVASRLIQREGIASIDARAAVVYAASEGAVLTLTELFKRGADPNSASAHGVSALMAATFHRRMPALELLLSQPHIRVNATSGTLSGDQVVAFPGAPKAAKVGQRTALMYATYLSNIDGITLLLAHGARRDLKDAEGRTAFDYACKSQLRRPDPQLCSTLDPSFNTSH